MEVMNKTSYWRFLHEDQCLDFYLAKVRHSIVAFHVFFLFILSWDNMLKDMSSAVVLTVEAFSATHNCLWTHIKCLVAQHNPGALGPLACGWGPRSGSLFSHSSVFTFISCRSIGDMYRLTILSVSLSFLFSKRSVLHWNLLQITWTCGGEGYCGLIQCLNIGINRLIVTLVVWFVPNHSPEVEGYNVTQERNSQSGTWLTCSGRGGGSTSRTQPWQALKVFSPNRVWQAWSAYFTLPRAKQGWQNTGWKKRLPVWLAVEQWHMRFHLFKRPKEPQKTTEPQAKTAGFVISHQQLTVFSSQPYK